MTDKRISLTRILAINWYGFRQILDVSGHTLIAGAFGTGKTALLDLLQYVLLGQHWRPNRAAAGNARSRSLVSYCLCDTNTMLNGEPHYTRKNGVTVIGLEFSRPLTDAQRSAGEPPSRETWGLRIEYSSATAEPRFTWFGLPDRLEWENIAPGGDFLEEETFRSWIRREYGRECLFSRQADYLLEMATTQHLYFESDAFRRTLPKAIAFEPEDNVEKFLREFVLEENPLEVRDVRAAVSAYRETHATLLNQRNEAEQLRKLCTAHELHETAAHSAAVYRHVEKQLAYDAALEQKEKAQRELTSLQNDHQKEHEALEDVLRKIGELEAILSATRLEVSSDPNTVELEKLTRQRDKLHAEIQRIEQSQKKLREQFFGLRQNWQDWLDYGEELAKRDTYGHPLTPLLAIEPGLVEKLTSSDLALAQTSCEPLVETFQTLRTTTAGVVHEIKEKGKELGRRLQQITLDLEALERNEEPGACPLFRALRERFGDQVRQLGRLIEVKAEADRWWPAIELVLGARRFLLLVEKSNYREALEILRRTAPGRDIEELINPRELDALSPTLLPGSLAEKIDVEDPIAQKLTALFLGKILCVETLEELENTSSPCAITPDGIFKESPFRKRLLPEKTVILTLGERGRARLKNARETERLEVKREFDRLELLAKDFSVWLNQGIQGGLGTVPQQRTVAPEDFQELQNEWRSHCETIHLLSTPERAARIEQLKEHEETYRQFLEKKGTLTAILNRFQPRERKLTEQLAETSERLENLTLNLSQLRAALPTSISQAHLDAAMQEIKDKDVHWIDRTATAIHRAEQEESRSKQALLTRDMERRQLVDSNLHPDPLCRHPQYRTDFDPTEASNDRWKNRFIQLDTIEIPRYESLASERRLDWERRLRESVLDRLKERLDKAEEDIKLLRRYLAHAVGKYRYSITQRRDPAFQTIWSLLDTGFEPTDDLLAGAGEAITKEALDELMRAVEATGSGLDERARRLLDYRHYHHYDIEMVLKDDPQAPAISLGRSGRSLSGGENQAPFFISMLAAFRRVYDHGSERSQHLGLVVMDEAFSKLSGDGVEDCLTLARNFQLQLLMAFPIDRLGVMAPYADTVIICRKEETRNTRGFIEQIHNIPLCITAEEALESLE